MKGRVVVVAELGGRHVVRNPLQHPGEIEDTEHNEHEAHGEFHRQTDTRGNHPAEKNDTAANEKDRQGVAHAPETANDGGMLHRSMARNDRRDRDHVIGVGGMAHAEKEAESDDGKKADHELLTTKVIAQLYSNYAKTSASRNNSRQRSCSASVRVS